MSTALLKPRPYQTAAIEAIVKGWDAGLFRPAVVLPTGAGKTVIFAHLAERWYTEHGTRVLVLVHTEELISQAVNKLHDVAPHLIVGVIQGTRREHAEAHVIVATRQTLGRNDAKAVRLRDSLGAIGLIIIDECHHATARQYRIILDHFGALAYDEHEDPNDKRRNVTDTLQPGALVVGFTATLVRGDGAALGEVWQKVVFKRDIIFMIKEGYLLPARGKRIMVADLDFRNIKRTGGDYQAGDLGEALTESLAPELVAQAYKEHASDRTGLIFTPTVESAYVFAEALVTVGISCEVVHGAMPKEERKLILKRLESGELQTVANCMVLTEGFDCPRVSCAVIARPTTSVGLYTQMLGRILRPYPGQVDALLIDVVGVSGRHKLASLVDLVGDPTLRKAGTDDPESLIDLLLTADGLELDGPAAGPGLPPPEWQYGETVTFDVDLFARSRSTWLTTIEGAWCMPAGEHVVFLAPDGGSGRWSVALVHAKSRRGAVAYRGLSQDAAMSWGERVIDELGAGALTKRSARWRAGEPSPAQLTRAKMIGITGAELMTKGNLSDAITVHYASAIIDPYVRQWGKT